MNDNDFACLKTNNGDSVMLKGMRVVGDLRGLMFEARVEQRFSNSSETNVEVIYTFPLPWGAVLLDVEAQLGEQRLTGVVVEKKQAVAQYEEAISDGDAAIMLEKNRDHSYSLNLGNLAAGEECLITFRYAQTLQFEQRGLRVLVPTVIAPRYGNPILEGGMQPHQVTGHDLLADYPFEIELHLHGELPHARVASPSHSIRFVQSAADSSDALIVSLARRGALDRDFVLVLDELKHDSVAVLARDAVTADGVVALASFCPHLLAKTVDPLSVKILVDCSGSMAGDSIDAAKRSLQAIVQQLKQGDRFSLSRFGSTVEHRSRGVWLAKDATRMAAQRWINGLQADLGGTEMNEALISTFRLAQTAPSDVLIVTDGEIQSIDLTITSAKTSQHRLFIVGIGSSPAESHLRRLADATGGACDFVAPGEAVEPAVIRMFARLRSPRLTELSVVWPEETTPAWVSPLSSAVFDGDTVNVFAIMKHAPVGHVRLMGRPSKEGLLEEIGCIEFGAALEPGNTLARVAASKRVGDLLKSKARHCVQAATQLAVDYQLVTEQTNFLMIHRRAEEDKPKDMPELHAISQMVPAGWGGVGSVNDSRFSSQDCNLCFDMDQSSVPAVVRRASSKSASSDKAIPAFLQKVNQVIDATNPRYWANSADYTGLTPLGLCEWLSVAPRHTWPTTYKELRSIGVGVFVVEWLELAIARPTALPEAVVIGTFLSLMAKPEIRRSLMQSIGLIDRAKGVVRWAKGLFAEEASDGGANVNPALEEEIVAALKGMTFSQWPEGVFAMDTV